MFNPNQHSHSPLSSPTLSNPLPTLASAGSASFMPPPTTAPPLHAPYLTSAPPPATLAAADVDMLVDQPSVAVDDVMMTDDRMLAEDDPMTGAGGGLESESEMMIDDQGGPGATTPMSVTMVGDGDVDVEMVVASDPLYDMGGAMGSAVDEHQQQLVVQTQFVQQGFESALGQSTSSPNSASFSSAALATPGTTVAQEGHHDATLDVEVQEQPFAQVRAEGAVESNSVSVLGSEPFVVNSDQLDYEEQAPVGAQDDSDATQALPSPLPTALISPSPIPTATSDPNAVTVATTAESTVTATAQNSPHAHSHDREVDYHDDDDDDDEAQGYVGDEEGEYYDAADDDGELPDVTLSFNGVTYSVFPPLASSFEQQDAVSSSPSSPSHPPLFPTADESELASIRHGTVNDFMWRVKERFDLGEDMDVALKYVNLDGIVIREETSIGYDNQFDSFWSLYLALYPDATDPLQLEVIAELSAAAKLDMLLYRAQYPEESVVDVESPSSSSPSPPAPVDSSPDVHQAQAPVDGAPEAKEAQASVQDHAGEQHVATADGDVGQGAQHENVSVVESYAIDNREPTTSQVPEPEASTTISDSAPTADFKHQQHQEQQQLQQQQQHPEERASSTQEDCEYVDEDQGEFEGTQGQGEAAQGGCANEDSTDGVEVQESFGTVYQGDYSFEQEQPPGPEGVVAESTLLPPTEPTAAPDLDTYAPNASEAASTDAPEQHQQPAQHMDPEELLDWEEAEADHDGVHGQAINHGTSGEALLSDAGAEAEASSPLPTVSHQYSSTVAIASGIPPSPAPTVEPHAPAPGSAPASRPSSPAAADSVPGIAGELLVAGEAAPAATNGSMKRSLEMVGDDDFGASTESEHSTSYKRQRTSEDHD